MRIPVIVLLIIFGGVFSTLSAKKILDPNWGIQDIEITSDTALFSAQKNAIQFRGKFYLPFEYSSENQIIEIKIYPSAKNEINNLQVIPSKDYQILDSILFYNNSYYQFRIQFNQLSSTDFLALNFIIENKSKTSNIQIPIFAYTQTSAIFYQPIEDVYIGEEKKYEIITNNIANLKLSSEWQHVNHFDYQLKEENGKAFIYIIPNKMGQQNLPIIFTTKKPFITSNGIISYDLPVREYKFNIRASRLSFLRIDDKNIIVPQNFKTPIEITLENHRLLELEKTYRIEKQEERGGELIAELFTKTRLSNDKVICIIRPYAFHSMTDGFLFIKDGDVPKFLTNANLLPDVKISSIEILRGGNDWINSNEVFPGEKINIRFRGVGLSRANLILEDITYFTKDTLAINNDIMANFVMEIPIDFKKKSIEIFNKTKQLGNQLIVKEFQRPKKLDFVKVNYGNGDKLLTRLNETIFANNVMKDVVLEFDTDLIDSYEDLYGKQFMEINIRLLGARNELIEFKTIDNLEFCPSENSPRFNFVNGKTCSNNIIQINDYLDRKTFGLEDWSKIEIIVKHKKNKYDGEEGYEQKVFIVLQKLITFDVEVSFPAGLIIKKIGEEGFPSLGGISLAMIAQFTFYDAQKIRVEKPYKIGAGFIALNAFNFSPNIQDRDLGILVLGSVYPLKNTRKLSFPLYMGFGYFLNQSKLFYLIGPGIRINF